MDKLEYGKVYELLLGKRKKKTIPSVFIGSFEKKRLENNYVITFFDEEVNLDTRKRNVNLFRFSDYELKGNILTIKSSLRRTYSLKKSEEKYLEDLLNRKIPSKR